MLNNEIDWRIKLKIIESLQKKQGKNQAKKKELGPNLKILKNENSRLKDAIRKKKTYKMAKDKNWQIQRMRTDMQIYPTKRTGMKF